LLASPHSSGFEVGEGVVTLINGSRVVVSSADLLLRLFVSSCSTCRDRVGVSIYNEQRRIEDGHHGG
jgi:hypothetical protein